MSLRARQSLTNRSATFEDGPSVAFKEITVQLQPEQQPVLSDSDNQFASQDANTDNEKVTMAEVDKTEGQPEAAQVIDHGYTSPSEDVKSEAAVTEQEGTTLHRERPQQPQVIAEPPQREAPPPIPKQPIRIQQREAEEYVLPRDPPPRRPLIPRQEEDEENGEEGRLRSQVDRQRADIKTATRRKPQNRQKGASSHSSRRKFKSSDNDKKSRQSAGHGRRNDYRDEGSDSDSEDGEDDSDEDDDRRDRRRGKSKKGKGKGDRGEWRRIDRDERPREGLPP